METDFGSEHNIIVVGASMGGVEAVPKLVRNFPRNLEAAVLITLPAAPHIPHLLTMILNKSAGLPAHQATHGEAIEKGHVYVAPPDQHLKIWDEHIQLDHGPRENRHRPAIDALFRSAAAAFGSRVIGVVLSGSLDDGTAGLHAIKENGGITIVQDPMDTLSPHLPENLRCLTADFCLPVSEMGPLLVELIQKKGRVLCGHEAR